MRSTLPVLKAQWTAARGHFLFVPSALAVALGGLAVVVTAIERSHGPEGLGFGFGGDPSAARTLLSTIAGSLITVAGLTYSITIVSLQLVSQQLSPRALRNFLEDRLNQAVAGVFIGLFAYCLLVLRTVRSEADPNAVGGEFVPSTSITIAIVLAIAALGLLLVFIDHVTKTIQASEIVSSIAHATLSSVDDLYPTPFGRVADEAGRDLVASWTAEQRPKLVYPQRPGYVQAVALDDLPAGIKRPELRVHVLVCPGDFATSSEPMIALWGGNQDDRADDKLGDRIVVGGERTIASDVAFGVRQLADIAIRALSPSMNDPTTAATCVRYLGAILARLAGRQFPAVVRRLDGAVIVARRRTFEEYVDVAVVELGRHAARDVRVAEALLEAAGEGARAASSAHAAHRASVLARAAADLAHAAHEAAASGSDQLRIAQAFERVCAVAPDATAPERDVDARIKAS